MNTLVSHPALYGWNWSDEINGGGGLGDIPAHGVGRLLNADPLVSGWTGVYFSTLQIDGMNVPVMGGSPNAAVGPPLLSGHAFDGANQVVLGAGTLAQLHKHVGDTVTVGAAGTGLTTLRIVGTATMPSIGVSGSAHLEMGTRRAAVVHVDPAEGAQRLRRAAARAERRPRPLQEGGEPGQPPAPLCNRSSARTPRSRATGARWSAWNGRRRSSTTARWARRRPSSGSPWPPAR